MYLSPVDFSSFYVMQWAAPGIVSGRHGGDQYEVIMKFSLKLVHTLQPQPAQSLLLEEM